MGASGYGSVAGTGRVLGRIEFGGVVGLARIVHSKLKRSKISSNWSGNHMVSELGTFLDRIEALISWENRDKIENYL